MTSEADKRPVPAAALIGELDRRFRLPLIAYFRRRVSSASEAEDLTQDVFVRAIQSLTSFRAEQAVPYRAYLLQIARNLVIDRWRASPPGTTSYQALPEHCLQHAGDGVVHRAV